MRRPCRGWSGKAFLKRPEWEVKPDMWTSRKSIPRRGNSKCKNLRWEDVDMFEEEQGVALLGQSDQDI